MSKPVADAIAAREEAKRPIVVEEPKPRRKRVEVTMAEPTATVSVHNAHGTLEEPEDA